MTALEDANRKVLFDNAVLQLERALSPTTKFSTTNSEIVDDDKRPGKKKFNGWRHEKRSLTRKDIIAHLEGKRRLHVRPTKYWCQLDIDRDVSDDELRDMMHAVDHGIFSRSKSGRYHVNFFFADEYKKAFLEDAIQKVGEDGVEFFDKSVGKYVTVPLFGMTPPVITQGGVIIDGKPELKFVPAQIVEEAKPKKKGAGRPTIDHDRAFNFFTQYVIEHKGPPDQRERWVYSAMYVKAALGEDGFDKWHEWVKGFDGYTNEKDCRVLAWDQEPTCPESTFWLYAYRSGYRGGLPEGISFEEAIDEFNEKFAVILEGSRVGVLYPQFDPELKRERYSILSKSAFTFLEKESKEAHMWLTSPRRRTYTGGFIYAPERDYPDCFNLWRGFSVKEVEGDWSLLDRHIFENISAEDHERYDYNRRWHAWSVQNPGSVAEVAFVMRGVKGTGKGVLANAWLALWGRHGLAISNPRHLVGNFNAHMRDLSALFVDEGYWAGDKQGEGVLKSLLTESFRVNEAKGVDSFPVKNCLKLMIASNEDWVVPATQGERRYHVNDVAPTHAKDSTYFQALLDQLYKEGGLPAWLFYLRHLDLDGWHPRDNIPWTDGLADQIKSSERPEDAAMRMILELGQLPGTHPSYHSPDEVAFPRMREAVKRLAYGGAVSDFRIAKVLQKVGGERSPEGVEYKGMDTFSGKPLLARAMMYRLPPLDECRKRFDPQEKWNRSVTRWEYELAMEGQNDIEPGSEDCM